jgi:hypothetical protein
MTLGADIWRMMSAITKRLTGRVRTTTTAMGRALCHRNSRLNFFDRGTSLFETWLTRVAISWPAYRRLGVLSEIADRLRQTANLTVSLQR